ncbi:hypothetical protein EVAR_2293_1 [Eumeta japonica]|uniref:Uncharacterized protein n=1 Tax=Eumeta variegata TaxID=151549 RepID=A0A4C1SFS1_EUMVA|nr:hypothetical protein EVAR_2293_1 [Eumeta japonica]
MPSRLRSTPTGANAGRPTRVSATEHARRAPDRPARYGTAAATDMLTKLISTAAHRARRTLNAANAARLPRCRRQDTWSDIVAAAVGWMDSLISGRRRARLDLGGADHQCVLPGPAVNCPLTSDGRRLSLLSITAPHA